MIRFNLKLDCGLNSLKQRDFSTKCHDRRLETQFYLLLGKVRLDLAERGSRTAREGSEDQRKRENDNPIVCKTTLYLAAHDVRNRLQAKLPR